MKEKLISFDEFNRILSGNLNSVWTFVISDFDLDDVFRLKCFFYSEKSYQPVYLTCVCTGTSLECENMLSGKKLYRVDFSVIDSMG